MKKVGIGLAVFLRLAFGLFFFAAGINKLRQEWLTTDRLHQVFTERLAELEPGSFAANFLTSFGIPWSLSIAWVVTLVELVAGLCLLLGLATRVNAALAFWLMIMIGIGGYYDASLLPLFAVAAILMVVPAGHWFGLDRRLHGANPGSIWFR